MGIVKAVCVSTVKGTQKSEVSSINLKPEHGITGDAHAGAWHRQVSLLSYESIEAFKARGAEVVNGSFAENIIVEGIELKKLIPGDVLTCGNVKLEVTQIGKECHAHCDIYHKMGECIMPREGIFTRVLSGGEIQPGKEITLK